VINASGVILQTNLGRAPLGRAALTAMGEVAAYSNLEFDLEAGGRGSRHEHVRELIRRATGAEDGLVVNNNAAALFMVLQVFAQGREVIVSRGQAVEIGGGFRIPDVLRQSGARLVEVGTTNRTYARRYETAIIGGTRGDPRVHTSNFQVIGFTAERRRVRWLKVAGRQRACSSWTTWGAAAWSTQRKKRARTGWPTSQPAGKPGSWFPPALFSGDKLLAAHSAALLRGRAALITELRTHPLARALRVDKLTIAALNATLLQYWSLGRQDTEVRSGRCCGAGTVAPPQGEPVGAGSREAGATTRSKTWWGEARCPARALKRGARWSVTRTARRCWRGNSATPSRRSLGVSRMGRCCSIRAWSTRLTTRWWRPQLRVCYVPAADRQTACNPSPA